SNSSSTGSVWGWRALRVTCRFRWLLLDFLLRDLLWHARCDFDYPPGRIDCALDRRSTRTETRRGLAPPPAVPGVGTRAGVFRQVADIVAKPTLGYLSDLGECPGDHPLTRIRRFRLPGSRRRVARIFRSKKQRARRCEPESLG